MEQLVAPAVLPPGAGSRAAQAAARVAARYAQAPSYSEMQAAEARVAVRAAEIATQVALEAQANAEAVLADLKAASSPAREPAPLRSCSVQPIAPAIWESEAPLTPEVPAAAALVSREATPFVPEESGSFGLRWEPDLPSRRTEIGATRATFGAPSFEISPGDWWAPAEPEPYSEPFLDAIEPALSIPANLIEFPRELVATRKVRPRRAEGEFAETGSQGQLSIFEVDPQAISIQPELPCAQEATAAVWPGMQLEENPQPEELPADPQPGRYAPALQVAGLNRRVMAAVVDGALTTALFLGLVLVAGSRIGQLPGQRVVEIGAAGLWAVIALLYQVFFFYVSEATPGMKYAGVSLCTFDDQFPTRARSFVRLGALVLSVLPLGLGLAWALFDEEHLGWHDRLSRTYQRKCQ